MNGLDPAGIREMRDMILSLVAEGRTVVLSSHLLDEVERPVMPWPSWSGETSSGRDRSPTCWREHRLRLREYVAG